MDTDNLWDSWIFDSLCTMFLSIFFTIVIQFKHFWPKLQKCNFSRGNILLQPFAHQQPPKFHRHIKFIPRKKLVMKISFDIQPTLPRRRWMFRRPFFSPRFLFEDTTIEMKKHAIFIARPLLDNTVTSPSWCVGAEAPPPPPHHKTASSAPVNHYIFLCDKQW